MGCKELISVTPIVTSSLTTSLFLIKLRFLMVPYLYVQETLTLVQFTFDYK